MTNTELLHIFAKNVLGKIRSSVEDLCDIASCAFQ